MFLEALSAVADDLSYTQDRVLAEAALVTATQRRSVVRHAQLVDDPPGPAFSSSVTPQFDVAPGVTQIPGGMELVARYRWHSNLFRDRPSSLAAADRFFNQYATRSTAADHG